MTQIIPCYEDDTALKLAGEPAWNVTVAEDMCNTFNFDPVTKKLFKVLTVNLNGLRYELKAGRNVVPRSVARMLGDQMGYVQDINRHNKLLEKDVNLGEYHG